MGKVTVAIRVRPPTISEISQQEPCVNYFQDDSSKIITPKNKYSFKILLDQESSQEEVFNSIGKPLVDKVLEGYDATIMAYGQTGSGKSYSMGTEMREEGLTQKAINHLFKANASLAITSVEIYKDEVYDLLSSTPVKLSVSQGVKAVKSHITKRILRDAEEAKKVLSIALKNRRIAATKGNENSSRSHMIITVIVEANQRQSLLNLVDLSGSEPLSENEVERDEGKAINQSLFFLVQVVSSLSKGSAHIPYRNSKLTGMLQDSLSAKNFIAVLACINPLNRNLEESEKTLLFASKFAKIEVTPIVNSQAYGTPYRTPRIQNKTFSTPDDLFKKPRPLGSLNRTVATPVPAPRSMLTPRPTPTGWAAQRRAEENIYCRPLTDLRRESSESINLSDVSTSTAFEDRGSPPLDRFSGKDSLPSAAEASVPMTPAVLAMIRQIVDKSVRDTEKRTTKRVCRVFERKLEQLGRTENQFTWKKKLSEVGLDQSLNDSSSSSDSEMSDGGSSALETTVVRLHRDENTPKANVPVVTSEPVFKIPMLPINPRSRATPALKTDNLNGSLTSVTSDDSCNSESGELDSGFKKPLRRQSIRLSLLRKAPMTDSYTDSDYTPASQRSESEYRPRRSLRLSICKRPSVGSEETPSAKRARRDSVAVPSSSVSTARRGTTKIENRTPPKSRGRKLKGDDEYEGLPHEERILKILQKGDSKELGKLATIGAKTAQLILIDRKLNGPLQAVGDLKNIRGLTKNQAQKFLWANSLD